MSEIIKFSNLIESLIDFSLEESWQHNNKARLILYLVLNENKGKNFLNKTSLLSMCTTDSGILSILFPHHIKTKKTEKKRKSCNLYKFFVLLDPNLSSNAGIYILQNISKRVRNNY